MALDCPDRKTTNKVGEPKSDGRVDASRPAVKCYRCHQPGHIALHCPQNAWYCGPQGDGEILAAGYIDGLPVHDMVADTGCSRTLVHAFLVPPHRRLREHVEVCCAHGDVTSQPLAEVDVELGGESFPMVVGVAETLPRSVLLGRDFPGLPRLLATRPQEGGKEALLVIHDTRAETAGAGGSHPAGVTHDRDKQTLGRFVTGRRTTHGGRDPMQQQQS